MKDIDTGTMVSAVQKRFPDLTASQAAAASVEVVNRVAEKIDGGETLVFVTNNKEGKPIKITTLKLEKKRKKSRHS